jgi:very-short-patch-repair endonuclease
MGKARRNQVEAERVVSMVVERLRDPARRDRSIGIVTFNTQQQDLIETLLEAERKKSPEIEPYFNASAPEPLFVKNLENVQGDERDVMIFSTTFGRDALGRLSMNFGPMNKAGGERRLNVAVTRARERLVVVTSMDPEDIDLTRSSAIGIKHLRDFLAYARDGRRALLAAVSASASAVCESPFELDVLAVCESLGWRVDCQVGCSGYRIDLAARDPQAPGRHVLAIECDGATYHSGATARDRDRLRQSVLEGLGWRFHRIWSTDWRLNRETEIERLKKAYKDACDAPRRPPGRGANRELRSEAHATQDVIRSAPTPVATVQVKPQAPTIEAVDPKAVTDTMRRDAILAVLQEGGTMPREALIKAAANRVGHQRVGTRIKDAFAKVVDGLLSQQRLVVINDRITLK